MNAAALTSESAELVEAIALRVVELLDERQAPARPKRLLTAGELASVLGVDRKFVYDHAEELGCVRLGSGSKPRLRFDLEQARAALACCGSERSQAPEPSDGGRSAARERGRRRREALSAARLPNEGSVLTIRPRGEGS